MEKRSRKKTDERQMSVCESGSMPILRKGAQKLRRKRKKKKQYGQQNEESMPAQRKPKSTKGTKTKHLPSPPKSIMMPKKCPVCPACICVAVLLCCCLFYQSVCRPAPSVYHVVIVAHAGPVEGRLRCRLRLGLANLPAPRAQHLDHLGRHGGRQGHAHKDEALVDGVGEGQLRGEAGFVLVAPLGLLDAPAVAGGGLLAGYLFRSTRTRIRGGVALGRLHAALALGLFEGGTVLAPALLGALGDDRLDVGDDVFFSGG
jgi:hypothetical protein